MGARVASIPVRRLRLWLFLAAVAVAVLAVRGVVAWLDWRDAGTSSTSATARFEAREVAAGAVTVKIQPVEIGSQGAVFKISFDTHSVALDVDVARQARLLVGGTVWPARGWSGDGPGGHHRTGELRFEPAGPAVGAATLTLSGLPKPVTATWGLAG